MKNNIEVLKEFRKLSRILTFYNRENFQITDPKWLQNFLIALIFSYFLLSFGMLLLIAIWFCFDCNFEISQIAFPISMSFYSLQVPLIYFSMASNNRKIIQTMDHIQEVIDKREPSTSAGKLQPVKMIIFKIN